MKISGPVYPDSEVVALISLPPEGRIPDPACGAATCGEYDAYFRIDRTANSLADWSRTCLEIHDRVLADLDNAALEAQDRFDIARGLLTVMRLTLTKWTVWVQAAEFVERETRER
jgi:hypothetical protein